MSLTPYVQTPASAFGQFVYDNWEDIQRSNKAVGRYLNSFVRAYTGHWDPVFKKSRKVYQGRLPSAPSRPLPTPPPKNSMSRVSHRDALGRRSLKVSKGKRRKRTKRSLKKRVTALERLQSHSTYDYRKIFGTKSSCGVNVCSYTVQSGVTSFTIEQSINALPQVTDANTVANRDATTTAYGSSKLNINNMFVEVTSRNNALNACRLDVYWFICVENTDNDPVVQMAANDADTTTANSNTNVLVYPSDISNLGWKMIKHEGKFLNPGDEVHSYYSKKHRKYDPSVQDQDGTTYSSGDVIVVFRIMGCVAHDSATSTNVGYSDAACDHVIRRKWKVQWDSEVPFRRIEADSTLGSITTAQTTHMDVEQN